ncbi:MAG: adenine phosphoribosyltransferase [Ardenticatenaceae bacterium]|nr:adenine phosphoribosyltransferase [Ardenticatenaceae bacterium]HBY95817.1 adenine phosphoribosyltransferase [Chloroflexota bacterium]
MDHLKSIIRSVPDFPVQGILFRDITTLLKDADAFGEVIDRLAEMFEETEVDLVAGVESRGFIFGAPLAYELGAGFVPIRKPGRLPAEKIHREYALEYGTNRLEIHVDAIEPGQRVLIIDDLLATGGTARASAELVEALGGQVVGAAFVIELGFLNGREALAAYPVVSLIEFDAEE